jgi:NADH:ubiquinone reductase (H+-translocating)
LRYTSGIDSHPAILINGAGYTGLELAIAMKRRAWREGIPIDVHVVEQRPQVLTFLSERQQSRVQACLQRHEIRLHMGSTIANVTHSDITLSDGTVLKSPLLCRAEGTTSPLQTADEGISHLPDHRMHVQTTLALAHYPDVFVAGDAAAFAIPAGYLRKAVNFAYYAGFHAGRNVARILDKRCPRPFLPVDLGWVIPLGDDSVGEILGGIPLSGKLGLRMHYVMCGFRNYSIRNFLRLVGYAIRTGATYKQQRGKDNT